MSMSFQVPSAGQAANAANPLTPGGLSPKGVHLPTLAWVVIILVGAFLVYHYVIRKG